MIERETHIIVGKRQTMRERYRGKGGRGEARKREI